MTLAERDGIDIPARAGLLCIWLALPMVLMLSGGDCGADSESCRQALAQVDVQLLTALVLVLATTALTILAAIRRGRVTSAMLFGVTFGALAVSVVGFARLFALPNWIPWDLWLLAPGLALLALGAFRQLEAISSVAPAVAVMTLQHQIPESRTEIAPNSAD
jgi:hypothetical protein